MSEPESSGGSKETGSSSSKAEGSSAGGHPSGQGESTSTASASSAGAESVGSSHPSHQSQKSPQSHSSHGSKAQEEPHPKSQSSIKSQSGAKAKSGTEPTPTGEPEPPEQPVAESPEQPSKSKTPKKSKSPKTPKSLKTTKSSSREKHPKTPESRRPRKRTKGEKITFMNARIGFVGAGKMTEAIVKGLTHFAKTEPSRIYIASKTGKSHEHFKQMGIATTKRNYDIFGKMDCDIVILAFHGHVIRQLYKMGGMRPMALTTNFIPNQRHEVFVMSLVGGVTLTDIKHTLLNPDNPEKYKISMHRIMVNSSVAYGNGLAAIDIEPDSKKCNPMLREFLTSIAKLEHVPEANMDCACAVGGNGLAFCYYFLSAISDGGFKMGLPKNMAVKLATKTLQSAASSLLESGKHPSDLRDQSTSPSGPAIYGIHCLDKTDCASGIAAAVEGAYKRIKDLVEI